MHCIFTRSVPIDIIYGYNQKTKAVQLKTLYQMKSNIKNCMEFQLLHKRKQNARKLSGLLQVCLDAGAKRILIPIASAGKIATVPPDLFSKFQISFYGGPIDAVYSMALI